MAKNPKKTSNSIRYIFNIGSLLGFLIAGLSATLIIILLAYEMLSGHLNNYLGIVTFFALPGGIVFGLAMVVTGALWARHRQRVRGLSEAPPMPRIDLNDPHKRFHVIFFTIATFGLMAVVGIASLQGIHFAESPAFCGQLCHPPMKPEFEAWQNSPHANIRCVECHIGEGIQYHIKAKLNGTKQLYSILTGTFPTPIEVPVHNMRPANETCGKCHWKDKYYSGREKVFYHNAPNEANSSRQTTLLMKIGGSPKEPHAKGIHWHIDQNITFVSSDSERQEIPYIALKNADGSVTEYIDSEKTLSKEEIAKGHKRKMDCIDCHNRPTHIFHAPSQEIDDNFASGKLDHSLPYLKKTMLELLSANYKNEEEAKAAIDKGIREFYDKNYPAVATAKAESIKNATEVAQKIFKRNFFPKMKLAWNTYPNNVGHLYFPGCFRCHDGKHKSAAGKVISKECNLCHTMISQTQENIPAGAKVTSFVHPVDIGNEIMTTNCSECHLPKQAEGEKKAHKAGH